MQHYLLLHELIYTLFFEEKIFFNVYTKLTIILLKRFRGALCGRMPGPGVQEGDL